MHLKHLEVTGFKSFADNIKLDFEPGITAIVGPNGCGKSNIIDAIRWCLGEMSAKSLRSSMMLDVVFNGSGSRPPQNLAQVTLTFDNTDKRLPIDFSDVSITRRLFRSGESEYFINKTQCRLRDIKELFLDTGMGEDGYSSLEQGKVEWVLQAKPEERRELFEEAAGVSKYRARREEALRKLDRVEIDLSRLFDIITVTQEQIRRLENAVNKAKTYQRIREELKIMEIGDWLYQLANTDQELKDIHSRLETAQSNIEQLNTHSHQLDTELAEFRLTLTQLEEELLAANGTLHKIDSDIKIGEERLNSSRLREQELKKQIGTLHENRDLEEKRIDSLQGQLRTQSQAVEEIMKQGESIESEYADSKNSFESLQIDLETKKNQVKEKRDLILDRAQERARIHQQMSHLTSDLARYTSQSETTQKDKGKVQLSLEELDNTIEAQTRVLEQMKKTADAGLQRLEEVTQQTNVLNKRIIELREGRAQNMEDLAQLKAQVESIKNQQSHDPYLAGTQAILSAALPNVYGPLGRLFQCEESDRDIVSSTIGEHLGDLVAESTEDALKAVEYLRENQKGRVRIWILDKMTQTPTEESLLSLSNGRSLFNLIKTEERFKPLLSVLCSSLWIEGSTVFGRAVINGGSDPSRWKTHMTHRLPELESALAEKETRQIELTEALRLLESEIITINDRRETAMKETEENRVRLEMAQTEAERFQQKRILVNEEIQTIVSELQQIEENKAHSQRLYDESAASFQTLQSQEQVDHEKLDQLQHELTEVQQASAHASAELASKEARHKAYQEKLSWQVSVMKQSETDIENSRKTLMRYEESMLELTKQVEISQSAQQEASLLIETSIGKRQEAAETCAAIQTKRVAIAEKIQESELTLIKVRGDLKTAQEVVQTELIKESSLKSRSESLNQKLQDQYEMTLEAAKAQFSPAAADLEGLDKLKKRVANMGPINLAAPQEHAELMEKVTFLTNQQNDLLKAKDDLKQVIAKINATTREHFRETFQKVRENFRALYGKLFQGGEADLRFTDEADILNTGIDIFCQPPGKKLLHISLLSGGEKALTAIALLFAFFQVRPSPVALLDEVDAPLDEANVLRYVDMIKVFSQNSQFILISHNKRTMEAANALYGVTMEELGVSKVLSARLQKASAPVEPASVNA